MIIRLVSILLFCLGTCISCYNCAWAEADFRVLTPVEMIAKIQTAIDPQNKLDIMSSKISEGEIYMPAQNITAGVKTWFNAPDRFKIVTDFPTGQQEIETYDGKVVRKKPYDSDKTEDVTGDERNYFIFSALMEAPEIDWDKLFSKIELEKKYIKSDNFTCYKLVCTPKPEYSISGDVVFYVDSKDFLIRRMDMNTYYPGAGMIPQSVVIEEYRKFDSINVPVKSRSNVLGAEMIYTINKYNSGQ